MHFVTNPFDPWTSYPPGQTIPIKLIPLDKWSPTNPVPMEECPEKFGPPGQMVPNQFGLHTDKNILHFLLVSKILPWVPVLGVKICYF